MQYNHGQSGSSGNGNSGNNGNGNNGNGEVPPGQNVDENGNITNNGGNTPPGLNRRNKEKPDKDDNPNKPEKPDNPGSEDKSDSSANKAQQGTHIYTYDNLNRMSTSDIAKTKTTYTYDTIGNLVYEKIKNKSVDYQYNELNQLVKRTDSQNQTYTYQYDKRGNRIAETGKKESRAFVYDETNHLVEETNWKGDKSAYTYNALFVRINNTQTSHSGSVYSRDYVIDYTSLERDDLMIYAEGDGQLDYVQREVYAGSERIEQFTDRSNGGYERTLYVHEDVQGNTRYYTKTNGNSFAELTYDAWGMPVSPNKLLNNDHGNYVYATYTGHIFDTTLDIYFAEARFYDAQTRTWLAMDPIKDGCNWYQYCFSNPLRYWDPTGLLPTVDELREWNPQKPNLSEVKLPNPYNNFPTYRGCDNFILPAITTNSNNLNALHSISREKGITFSLSFGCGAVILAGNYTTYTISLDTYGNIALQKSTANTFSDTDEAYIGIVGYSVQSYSFMVSNAKTVYDLNGSGESVGASAGLTGSISMDVVNIDKNSDIDGVQFGYSRGGGMDIHIIKSTTTTLKSVAVSDIIQEINKFFRESMK